MKEWLDLPLEQWIYFEQDPPGRNSWIVIVGDYVRARVKTKERAEEIVKKIKAAFE